MSVTIRGTTIWEARQVSTPDTTSAQIIAYVTAALTALVVLFKLDISDVQQAAAITILTAVLGAFHLYSDSRIRAGRAQVAAAQVTATTLSAGVTALDGDDAAIPDERPPARPQA